MADLNTIFPEADLLATLQTSFIDTDESESLREAGIAEGEQWWGGVAILDRLARITASFKRNEPRLSFSADRMCEYRYLSQRVGTDEYQYRLRGWWQAPPTPQFFYFVQGRSTAVGIPCNPINIGIADDGFPLFEITVDETAIPTNAQYDKNGTLNGYVEIQVGIPASEWPKYRTSQFYMGLRLAALAEYNHREKSIKNPDLPVDYIEANRHFRKDHSRRNTRS